MASWLLIIVSTPLFGGDIELALGRIQEGRVTAGKPQSYVLRLNGGDYARIKVDARGRELAVTTYDPSGSRFRGATLGPHQDSFDFIVDRSGAYRADVVTSGQTIEAVFTIMLEKVMSLEARLSRPKPTYESPRIQALRASIEGGKKESEEAFWKEIQKEGAPIIESLVGDKENMLVTFLWRGTPDTHNVFVARLPHAGAAPDDYFMNRLGQTDVW